MQVQLVLYNFSILSIVELCYLKYNELSIAPSRYSSRLVDKDHLLLLLLAMVSFTAYRRCYSVSQEPRIS